MALASPLASHVRLRILIERFEERAARLSAADWGDAIVRLEGMLDA